MSSHWQPSTAAAADSVATFAVFLAVFTIFSSMTSTETANINNGETRCYCNEAGCVSTGYMCKSARLNACFSQLSRDGPTVRSTHGCVESLPDEEFGSCMQLEEAMNGDDVVDGRPVLICCGVDMCNYMDSVAIGVFFSRRDIEPQASATGSKRTHESRFDVHSNQTEHHSNVFPPSLNDGLSDADGVDDLTSGFQFGASTGGGMWLRVAIVAVPVIGVCLLIPLVVIATRLLTSDRRNASNKHSQLRHWLLAGHVTSAVTGNGAPIVSDHNCFRCRAASVGWCDCDNRKGVGVVRADNNVYKQAGCANAIPSFPPYSASHHRFVMAAIHNGNSGRRGYEQIRTHLALEAATQPDLTSACATALVTRHSLGGSSAYSHAEHLNFDRSIALTV